MAQRKKVLFTSHTANFHKFNRPFMRMLKEQGYIVHYASAGEEKVYDTDKHFDVPFERNPFKLGNLKAYFKLKRIIEQERYDMIHTHTPVGSVVTRLAARKAHKRGTRILYTAHGFHFFKGASILGWIIYYPIEKYMARYTDTLITINKEDYERAKAKFSTEVLYVSGVGVDREKFRSRLKVSERKELRKSLGIDHNAFVIIYPAELSKRKRQVWLINTLSSVLIEYENVHLLLPGGGSLGGKCKALVSELGLGGKVHLMGYRNDIAELMMASDLAVSSSIQEGLPVNLLEASAVGLPIIATDCRGNRDIVQNQGLVSSMDGDGFRNLVRQQIVSPAIRSNDLRAEFYLDIISSEMKFIYGGMKNA